MVVWTLHALDAHHSDVILILHGSIKRASGRPVIWAYEIPKLSWRFTYTLRRTSSSESAVYWTSGCYKDSIITMLLSSGHHYVGSYIIVTLLRPLLILFLLFLFNYYTNSQPRSPEVDLQVTVISMIRRSLHTIAQNGAQFCKKIQLHCLLYDIHRYFTDTFRQVDVHAPPGWVHSVLSETGGRQSWDLSRLKERGLARSGLCVLWGSSLTVSSCKLSRLGGNESSIRKACANAVWL